MENQLKIEVKKESILEGNFVSIFLGFWRRNGAQALPGNRRKSRKVEKTTFWTTFAAFGGPGEGFWDDFRRFWGAF